MAVYTKVSRQDLESFLCSYDVGGYRTHEGIAQGVTNSNFHLFTEGGRFVLTLFEEKWGVLENLPFYFSFTNYLMKKGIPCPHAIEDKNGHIIGSLCGKKAVLVSYLEGKTLSKKDIGVPHCRAMGETLARMHRAAQGFDLYQANSEDLDCWKKLAAETAQRAGEVEAGLDRCIAEELLYLEENWPSGLPAAIVHTDIFPDNVLFSGDAVTGVLDFYFSCHDLLAYDLAIVINAWCFDTDHRFCPDRFKALLSAYEEGRPLTESERAAMPLILRGACVRFLMTRLHDWLFCDPQALVTPHDPREYFQKLRFHQNERIFGR